MLFRSEYRVQGRGGKGRSGMATRDEDFVTSLFVASTHAWLLFFSSTGTDKAPLFSLDERVEMWRHEAAVLAKDGTTIDVQSYSNTLQVDFARKLGAAVIIRGLRAFSDFEYEFQMVAMNQRLNPQIETVFLMADPRHQAISSRLVKEIAILGGDITAFTTPAVAEALVKRCKERK